MEKTGRDKRRSAASGIAAMGTEHQLQVSLVAALEEALRDGNRVLAGRLVEKMTDLAEAHFLAEELLMRLHQYPEFDEHVAEHVRLVEELRDLTRRYAAGELDLGLEVAARLRASLSAHIHGPDRALAKALEREIGTPSGESSTPA